MSWDIVKLGDVIHTRKGYAFKSSLYSDCGVPIVRVSDFTLDEISCDNLLYYPQSLKNDYLDFELASQDVLIQTVGSWGGNPASIVGKVVHVPSELNGALLNQNAVKLVPIEGFDRDYLYYRLRSADFRSYCLGNATGAANQASITLNTINCFTFECPTFGEQRRIASLLGAYDKLIENKRRRIKLLEETAQRLYKEWFVDLHFPGYENVAIHGGLPEGWKRGKLGDIAEFRRGKAITQKDTIEGNVPVVAGGLEPAYYHNKANTACPVITVSGSGANAGFSRLYTTNIWASDCSFADSSMTENLLFAFLSIKVLANEFKQCQRGSAQPHVYPKHVNSLEIIIPDTSCLDSFKQIVEPFFSEIAVLDKGILVAREARDRLLPKLMSGEIEV